MGPQVSYDALKRARDILLAAASGDLPTIVQTVATEHGVTVDSPRAVYRALEARPMFPNVEVTPPKGSLNVLSADAIATTADYWLIANISAGDPLALDDACMVYLTALIRLAADLDGDGYLSDPVEFDFSPPVMESDTSQKRSVGVLVRMTFAEDL